ncbi:Lactoylglutathione lyase and related lyases [hydrothermal vent metagenome]|uniref:Lactoylglutathione lyase and related lyases n=1 Tax=hydrothermal vent metagenome TaxID=652676 RepID=A0A3B0RY31_9ZZZZ
MLAYTMLGSNDPEAAQNFYENVFEGAGIKTVFTNPNGAKFYSAGKGSMLGIGSPADGEAANNGNGTMIAIPFEETADVDAAYKKAIEMGAACEGEPGWRMPDIFYGAYFRDPDGNKVCACKMNMSL